MSEIDLNKAKAGDRFEDGRGNVMRYVGRYVGGDHTLQSVDKGLTWLYSDFGHCFYSDDYDLLRALLTEMPIEPQEDPSAKPTLLESLPVYSIPISSTEGETAKVAGGEEMDELGLHEILDRLHLCQENIGSWVVDHVNFYDLPRGARDDVQSAICKLGDAFQAVAALRFKYQDTLAQEEG